MSLTFKRLVATIPSLMLATILLGACGSSPQQYNQPTGIITGRCSQQFAPVIKAKSTAQPSSRSVYFVSGVHLYALDAGNGTMRWCMYAMHDNTHLSTLGEVSSLFTKQGPPPPPDGFSALTVSNGVVYTCSMNGYTYAFNSATGALLWQHNTSGANTSAPSVVDGIVYVGSGNIYALNAQDGSERWKYQTPDVVTSSPVIVNHVLYAGSYGDRVYALNTASGAVIWQYNTGGRVYVDPIVAGGNVFFGSGDDGPSLYAVNAQTGKLIWSNGMRVDSSLAFANGVLYVGSDNYLYALNPQNGAMLWRRAVPTTFNTLIANGTLYAASSSGDMYAFNASDGAPLWHTTLNRMSAGETTTPVLMNGELYVATLDEGTSTSPAILYALNASNGSEDWNASVNWNVSSIGVAA
ncbi:MAG TPA: PQQ-binding-like beta-propeller repeat protein [Ktedonosporobacter sp.]|nr:PQQ-binding-like beta-propeller repeat protein [Ktedonosporobacter sp.]